jgi:transcription elongation factor
MRHLTCAKASGAISAESAYMAATESAAHVAAAAESAAAATTTGLCTRGKKAAGKHCACQNHHRSSFHDTLHWMGGLSAAGHCQTSASRENKRRCRDGLEIGMPICRFH